MNDLRFIVGFCALLIFFKLAIIVYLVYLISTRDKVIAVFHQANVDRLHVIETKIDANTDISTKAFHEANTVNLKLEKLGIEHLAEEKKQTDMMAHRNEKESG